MSPCPLMPPLSRSRAEQIAFLGRRAGKTGAAKVGEPKAPGQNDPAPNTCNFQPKRETYTQEVGVPIAPITPAPSDDAGRNRISLPDPHPSVPRPEQG